MITLKTLNWSGLFSYGLDNSVALDEEPIVQLVGVNGSGKSSIPLVLEEVLFNRNSKAIKKGDVFNRELGSNKYSASCNFVIDDRAFTLSVTRSGATQKVKLLENGLDVSSHTATATFSQVEDLFGIDPKTFSQLIYQNSTSSLQFLTATDSNRKKFLIDLLSLDRYLTIFERVKQAYKEVNESLIKLQAKESTVRSWLEEAAKKSLVELELEPLPTLDSTKATQLAEHKAQLAEISKINSKIASNKHYKERLAAISPAALVSKKPKQNLKPLENRKSEVQLELRQQGAIITKYKGLTAGACPTCAQEIDVERINEILTTSRTSIAELRKVEAQVLADIAEAEKINAEVTAHQQLVSEFEQFSNLVDNTLPSILLDKQELEQSIASMTTYLKDVNARIEKVSKSNNAKSSHNAEVAAIRGQLESYTKQLDSISIDLTKVSSNLSVLEILKKAFSTTGLIAYKIENSVRELESLTNTYLAELSDGRFELLFELHNDKLNVVIVDNGKNIEITALSAGELCRVTTSTLLAIRRLMATLSKHRINVLFLDEVIDSLDLDGKERLIEVLLREDCLNTFLISHSYSHPLVKKLTIIKEDGISRIDYGS
jgi:DNA repair exonuclease SbcCD ATPase subunit